MNQIPAQVSPNIRTSHKVQKDGVLDSKKDENEETTTDRQAGRLMDRHDRMDGWKAG